MSRYTELKAALSEKDVSIGTLENDMKMKKSRLTEIGKALEELDKKEEADINLARETKLKELEEKSVAKIEKVITDIDQDILTVNKRYKSKSSKISKEEFIKYYKDELDLVDQVSNLSKEVYDSTRELIGDRLNSGIFSNLDKYEIDIDLDDLQDYLDRHEDVVLQLDKLKKHRNFSFYKTVDKILAKLNPCKDDEQDSKKIQQSIIVYLALCGSLSFVALYYCSSIIFLGCLGIGFANIRRSTKIRDLILDTKTLQDNVDDVRDTIDGYVEEDMEKQHDILDTEYKNVIGKLNEQRAIKESELQAKLKEVRDNFNFDDSVIRNSSALTRHSKNKEITDINNELLRDKKRLKEMVEERNELNRQLADAKNSLKEEILSFAGKDVTFNTKYILDIVGEDVLIWEHPKSSCCIIWRRSSDNISIFIRLFIAETMSKFRPGLCEIDIWDTLNIGVDYMVFTKPATSIDKTPGCCNIYVNEQSVNKNLADLELDLTKRSVTVLKEKNSIEEYNELMQTPEIDGLLLPYKFLIMDHFDLSLLGNKGVLRLLSQGPTLGIYPIIFLEESDLFSLGKDSEKLLNVVDRFYTLSGDNIRGKSKSKIKEVIEAEANNK